MGVEEGGQAEHAKPRASVLVTLGTMGAIAVVVAAGRAVRAPLGAPAAGAGPAVGPAPQGPGGVTAVVVAGAVVAWARLALPAEGADREVGQLQEVPVALADGRPFGEVPAAVVQAVEGPVVGAARLDGLPDGFEACEHDG